MPLSAAPAQQIFPRVRLKVSVVAQASRLRVKFGHFGLASRGIATAPANRGAPKAPIIPARPSGPGNRTGEAKALKARFISIPGGRRPIDSSDFLALEYA